jgi:hypothetical protein
VYLGLTCEAGAGMCRPVGDFFFSYGSYVEQNHALLAVNKGGEGQIVWNDGEHEEATYGMA